MRDIHDRPKTPACAKETRFGRLRGRLATGGLLLAGVLASIFLVDPPVPLSRLTAQAPSAPAYVPASERWIELGARSAAAACKPAKAETAASTDGREGLEVAKACDKPA
jgi:hypothetical protein